MADIMVTLLIANATSVAEELNAVAAVSRVGRKLDDECKSEFESFLKVLKIRLAISHFIHYITPPLDVAGWSSLAARRAHNPKVVGSNPAPATNFLLN